MYKKTSKAELKEFEFVLQMLADIKKKYGIKGQQAVRFLKDSLVAESLGCNIKMNTDFHGWDGQFKNGTYFENKNVSANAKSPISFSLKFQDTSIDKLIELRDTGVICTTSFFDEGRAYPGFIMIGNTKNVGNFLDDSYNPETRKSCQVSLTRCINNGFKLVTGVYTKEQVIDIISAKFPRLGKSLTLDDIYTKKELPALVASMME